MIDGSFERRDWLFQSYRKNLPDSDLVQESWNKKLKLNPGESVPEQLWSENYFSAIHKPTGVFFRVSAADFLQGALIPVQPEACQDLHNICSCHLPEKRWRKTELPFAQAWRSAAHAEDYHNILPTQDWTHASRFKGSFGGSTNCRTSPPYNSTKLPWDRLKDSSLPILWYTSILFYNDDLGDTGDVEATCKVRVMADFWYCVINQRIRVDGLGLCEMVTRVFHDFDNEGVMVRETEFTGFHGQGCWRENLLFYS